MTQTPCGDCTLGVKDGAICSYCHGTTFVEVLPINNTPMPEETPAVEEVVAPVEAPTEAPVEAAPEAVAEVAAE